MQKRSIDYSLLVVTMMLVVFGLLMVLSASYYMAQSSQLYDYDGLALFKKQLLGAGGGIGVMIFFMLFDYKKLLKLKYVILLIAVIMLILVLTPLGTNLNGASRWIKVFGINVQPLEIAKFALIVFTAATIYVNRNRMDKFRYGVMPNLIVLAAVCGLLLLQPNFSGVILLCVLVFIMIFVGGAKGWQLGLLGAGGGLAGFAVMTMRDYRVDRLISFADPWQYASDGGYQVIQSLYGISAGGIFGRGLGNGRQKFLWLPYGESDFIFSITAEELGLIGAIALIAMYIFFVYRGIKIAAQAPDLFGTMLATGITAIIGIQVIINIGVVTASIPATGVTLPFVSFGSSSLVIFMAMVGVLLNISKQSRRITMASGQKATAQGEMEKA